MRRVSYFGIMSVLLSVLLIASPGPVSAVERASDDFFTYNLETELMGIQVVGDMRYEFEGTSDYTSGGVEYSVNVMRVTGTLTGGVQMVEFMTGSVGGTVYETRDGAAVVREEMVFYANSTLGTGRFALVYSVVAQVNSTFSPPVLSQFDPSSTAPGDEWSETVSVTATNATWLNGELWGDPATTNTTSEYDVVVAPALEDVITRAGTFECLKISATNDTGVSLLYWWSSKVGNFVKILTYEEGESEPWQSLELTDYRHETPTSTILIVAVGAAVLVGSIIFLAFVLTRIRSRPPEPGPYQPPAPPGPPPM